MTDDIYQHTRRDVDTETLIALGSEMRIRKFRIPAPTVGTIALLDVIDSPLLNGAEVKLIDVFRALYVMERKQEAAPAIFTAIRAADAKDAATAWAAFDSEVTAFAQGCGQFDPADAIHALRVAMSAAVAGYSIIERSGDTEDGQTAGPFARLVLSGSRTLLGWFRRRPMRQ